MCGLVSDFFNIRQYHKKFATWFFATFEFLPKSLQHFALQQLKNFRKFMQHLFATKMLQKNKVYDIFQMLQKKGQCCNNKKTYAHTPDSPNLLYSHGKKKNT